MVEAVITIMIEEFKELMSTYHLDFSTRSSYL